MAWTPPCGTYQHVWFRDLSAKLWERYLLPRFERREPVWYCETGTCEAMSLIWALEHFNKPGALCVGIDPFWNSRHWHVQEGDEHRKATVSNVSAWFTWEHRTDDHCLDGVNQSETLPKEYIWSSTDGPRCEVHAESSDVYLQRETRRFDVCFVDGSHNADIALLDIILMFRLLKDGGVLIVDDYDREIRGGRPQVKPAVDAFVMAFRGYFDRLYEHQRQIAFVKRPRRRRGYPPILECGPVIQPG